MTQCRQQITEAITKLDASDKHCPVRISRKFVEICPKCNATANQGCGLWDRAAVDFIAEIRRIVE